MLHVGYTTPYRIVLLVLSKQLCYYYYPDQYISDFVVLITKHILNEESVRETCSEPTLKDIYNEIEAFSDHTDDLQQVMEGIRRELEFISDMYRLDKFMSDIKILIDEQDTFRDDIVILDRCSVIGLFFRKCNVGFQSLTFSQLSDLHRAFNMYINNVVGDSGLFNSTTNESSMWISDYNVKEFLKHQAEQIEKTGACSFDPTTLHNYLLKVEKQLPNISTIRQVRYLNYTRTKEYMLSLSHCHLFFDLSLQKGVDIQYSLLNLGILEYKFGHSFNALSALNDALSAARSNKDEYCLQEVQYWIETCRKNHTFNSNSSFTDEYLANMKTLTEARNMLRNGAQSRYVFEALYKSSIRIIISNIKGMHRSQFLTASLAWLRYGNSAMSETYLYLTRKLGDMNVDDVERTAITHSKMLLDRGQLRGVIDKLTEFTDYCPDEKELLMGWRQARARILQRVNRKRKLSLIERQEDKLEFSTPPYTDEYFDVVHNNALNLILNKEFEKALLVLDETQDFIRKTDYTAQLGYNLILQAEAHMQMHSLNTSIPLLIEAMTLCKRSCDISNYYNATIKLAQAYTRTNDKDLLEKSIFMLESIFPKVLLMKSKVQDSNLYLAYAEALSMDSLSAKEDEILEYVSEAEQGYRDLGLKNQLLRTLHFKAMLFEKLKLPHLRDETLSDIRNHQKSEYPL